MGVFGSAGGFPALFLFMVPSLIMLGGIAFAVWLAYRKLPYGDDADVSPKHEDDGGD